MSAIAWALLTAVIWGIVPLLEKQGLGQGSPVIGVFARSLGVILGFLVLGVLWSPWKALAGLSIRSMALLALGGFLASFVGQMAFYHALRVGNVSQVTPLAGIYPMIAALLGWLLLREPFTMPRLVGVCMIVAGTLLLRR